MTTAAEPYVSRAGRKLAHALDAFAVDMDGATVLDAGAATGGFTDCCLQRGARLVYAVDVAYGSLAWRLRQDQRVRVLERTNLRTLAGVPGPAPDHATLDLSFIALSVVWPAVLRLCSRPATVVALIKPQFEARRSEVPRGGVVPPEVGERVARAVLAQLAAAEPGTRCRGPIPAQPRGRSGTVEWSAVLELAPHPGAAP
ncbi:MAG TPA: SAM-dependent methyltransferase [Candidatus Micrarchaeia archaeon]|nr:SAM-dependent methyltransferase [Candidatus Micrarchaeia archaeon]